VETITFWTILVVFVVAWGSPLLLTLYYRRVTVKDRFAEIIEALIDDDAKESPARHYLQLFTRRSPAWTEKSKPEAYGKALEAAVKAHLIQFQSWPRYAMSLSLLAIFSAAAAYFVWAWVIVNFQIASPWGPIGPSLKTEAMLALAGAYTWSLFELASRARRGNLTPDELFDVSIRYLFALPIGYVGALLSVEPVGPVFAFIAASFPLRDIQRYFRKRTLEQMKIEEADTLDSKRAGYLTQVVDGLSPDTVARLEEIGITTFTDLAYADPIRIMVKAGFSLRHIIQWMDHATLAIYALDHKKKLAKSSICCSLDAKEFYETHFVKLPENAKTEAREREKPVLLTIGDCRAVTQLAERTGVPGELLREIFMRIAIDPHVLFLDKMWYSGYAEPLDEADRHEEQYRRDKRKRPATPECPFHAPEPKGLHAHSHGKEV
jgi:hypothetical protein